MNIVDIALGNDDLGILVQALTTADLVTTIQTSNDITVFAPTDAAFTQLALDLGFTGDETDETAVFDFIAGVLAGLDPNGDPIPLLTSILTYHVSPGVQDAAAVTAAGTISTLNGAEIAPEVPVLGDLEPDLLDPTLIQTDIAADNGIVHLIDRVLLPLDVPGNVLPSITELVAASGGTLDEDPGDFDILLTAVTAAGLDVVLDTAGLDATVFAPTDAAFIALAETLGAPAGSTEQDALDFILGALSGLGGGDPIPLLTEILTFHVAPGSLQSAQVLAAGPTETLQGGDIVVAGTSLVDRFAALPDPNLVVEGGLDLLTSNGIVHTIDGVLLPFALPTSDGSGLSQVVIGTDARDRLEGTSDNDLIVQKGTGDLLIGGGGSDVFQLADSGLRSKIIDFEEGSDLIDVSIWGATQIEDLIIVQRSEGSLLVGLGSNSLVVQAADGAITEADVTDSFIFSDVQEGETITGTDGRDRLEGTEGDDVIDGGLGRDFYTGNSGADVFVAGTDTFDIILDYVEGRDRIDISGWGVSGLGDLTFTQLRTSLVEITAGGNAVRVAAADREIAEDDFQETDFIFV